jgi:hypothetical protein
MCGINNIHLSSVVATFMGLMLLACVSPPLYAQPPVPVLSARNTEVPFCYLTGGSRRWPVFTGELGGDDELALTARKNGEVLESGKKLTVEGLRVTLSREGFLKIVAPANSTVEFQVEVAVKRDGKNREQQQLAIRPAPPDRPISYVADLVDDLIRIYWDSASHRFRPITKDGFDQYFRRLQAQGITRLIVWQSPFPLIADPANYEMEDWRRFERQARAILDCKALTDGMRETAPLKSYEWLGMLMKLRLSRDFDRMFTRSASEHGIKLTASFRPFEAALTKYYEVPAFDADGTFLWGFLLGATPVVNYHPDQVSFAHYREILRRMERPREAELKTIEIAGLADPQKLATRLSDGHRDVALLASPVPPLDETSFVLVRQDGGHFELVPYASIRDNVETRRLRLDDAKMRVEEGRLIIDGVELPDSYRYLLLRSASDYGKTIELPVIMEVTLRSRAGNRLGRSNVYCSLDGKDADARLTRVAGIPANGLYHTEFQAIEKSIDYFRKTGEKTWRLGDGSLVIDRGDLWSVEMTDFSRPAAREFVVRELKTIMSYDAFDEILINTRSHTQLSASTGDGVDGIRPMAHYRLGGKNYFHYGIDHAFGPIAMAGKRDLQSLAVERISTWQAGEWQGPCQSENSEFVWRYQRNQAVADGVRALLVDLEREFPRTRIRAVIPQGEPVIRETEDALAEMAKPGGGVYGRDYFRHVWGSLNYIPAIGEGMAMVDLSGLSVEPVFLGIRYAPDSGPLDAFVGRYVEDFTDNCGSHFKGPKSFFYEAQETLRAADKAGTRKRREEIICNLLGRDAIGEVLLYEAADWTYYLPLSDRALSSHAFLDACAK